MTTKEPTRNATYAYCCKPKEDKYNSTSPGDWFATENCDHDIGDSSYTSQKPCLNWGHYSAEFPVGLYGEWVREGAREGVVGWLGE